MNRKSACSSTCFSVCPLDKAAILSYHGIVVADMASTIEAGGDIDNE
jgi:hypothetical protein